MTTDIPNTVFIIEYVYFTEDYDSRLTEENSRELDEWFASEEDALAYMAEHGLLTKEQERIERLATARAEYEKKLRAWKSDDATYRKHIETDASLKRLLTKPVKPTEPLNVEVRNWYQVVPLTRFSGTWGQKRNSA